MDADASAPDERKMIKTKDRATWRAWLEARHADSPSIWLLFHKQSSGRTGVSYEEAVEEALCFGWIDSRRNMLDEHRYIQLFAPRKPRGAWSRINKERIERLVAAGLMAPRPTRPPSPRPSRTGRGARTTRPRTSWSPAT